MGEKFMSYNQGLANDVRMLLGERPNLVAKEMFGGMTFMLNGHMAVGVSGDGLMVRVGPEQYEAALSQPRVGVFPSSGRPMRGWVLVEPAGLRDDADLERWVTIGVTFAESLPPK
jgi:hypothetical protein